jgi:hypothetical protein
MGLKILRVTKKREEKCRSRQKLFSVEILVLQHGERLGAAFARTVMRQQPKKQRELEVHALVKYPMKERQQ